MKLTKTDSVTATV